MLSYRRVGDESQKHCIFMGRHNYFPVKTPYIINQTFMISWILIGGIAAVLTMFGFVPQIAKMYRTKSVSDVSVLTLFQFMVGVTLWAVYGYAIEDVVVIGANIISLLTLIVALSLYYHYRAVGKKKIGRIQDIIQKEVRDHGDR
jgi:MtN3 and saliva related transmembrane protein